MAKKQRKTTSNDRPDVLEDITPIICRLKHEAIDKEFENIKCDDGRRHDEMKSIISSLQENIKKDIKISHDNLKDKIILTEKTIGDKIDSLSDFDDTLKGNGTPGVWESIRGLNKIMKVFGTILLVVVVFELGGSWNRVNWNTIRKSLGFFSPKVKQVEPVKEVESAKKEAEPIEEVKLSAMPKD